MKKPSNRTRVAERRNPKVPYANAHREHLERLLDRALEDSFPASDPLGTLVPGSAAGRECRIVEGAAPAPIAAVCAPQ